MYFVDMVYSTWLDYWLGQSLLITVNFVGSFYRIIDISTVEWKT